MGFQIDLSKFLTPAKVKDYIKRSPVNPRTFTKELYSKDVDTHPSPVYSMAEIQEVTGNVPLVVRGGEPVNVAGDKLAFSLIEPQPIDITDTLSAVDIMNMMALGDVAVEKLIQEKVNKFRRIVLNTVEALAIDSLDGKINYKMKVQGGYDTFEVNFGETKRKDASAKPEKLSEFYKLLTAMKLELQKDGYGNNVVTYAGVDVYGLLLDLSNNYTGKAIRVEMANGGIMVGDVLVKPVNSVYTDPQTKAVVKAVPDDQMVMVDRDAPFRLRYLAIDDLRALKQARTASAVATPLFVTYNDKGKNIELEAQSKPLVIPVPQAICWSKVIV